MVDLEAALNYGEVRPDDGCINNLPCKLVPSSAARVTRDSDRASITHAGFMFATLYQPRHLHGA
jgi:hypothetical protein